jgi:hypothetical protein
MKTNKKKIKNTIERKIQISKVVLAMSSVGIPTLYNWSYPPL